MKKIMYLVIVTLLTLTSCSTQSYYVDNMYPQPRPNTTTVVDNFGYNFYYNSLFWFNSPFYDPFWNPMWGWNNIYLNRWNIPYYPYHYVPRNTVAPRTSRTTPPTRYERRSESIYLQPRTVEPSRTRTEKYNKVTTPSGTVEPSRQSRSSTPSANPSRNNNNSFTPYRQSTTPSRTYSPTPAPSRQSTTPSRTYSPASTAPSRRSGNN